MVNRWYPVGCCRPKAFEPGKGSPTWRPGRLRAAPTGVEETGGGNPKAHVECNIPCCLARWPCTPESPLPIGFAGIHPGFLVRHPSKSPFTPISQIAEGQLFEIWEYYLILERGWVGGRLLSGYDSRRLVCLPTCTLKKCPGKTRALRAKV